MTGWLLALALAAGMGDPRSVALGRKLFFDTRLSGDSKSSCAGCHEPEHGFSNGRPVAPGVRKTSTLVNRGAAKSFFWDGRTATLEEQVVQPVLNPKELGMTADAAEALIRSDAYGPQFREIFSGEPTLKQLGVALASYVRTIVSENSRYDRFEKDDKTALTRAEIHGLFLFRQKAGCSACHFGPNLTDEQFHNTGIASRPGATPDPGRAAVTGDAQDRGAFKTPTLRDVARRAPYMHDGSLATLEDVMDYYDQGGEGGGLDPHMHPLHLTAGEKNDIVAYLRALDGAAGLMR